MVYNVYMKICTICKLKRRGTSFYADSRRKDGLRSQCKKCYGVRYKYVHSKKKNKTWQKYAKSEKGVITLLLNNAKDRAKRNNVLFSLDRDWLDKKLKVGVCEVSGIKFKREVTERYRANPFAASIDKIDSKGGYTKENCRLVCFCVNMARSDWGDEVLIKMSKAILKTRC